MLVLREILASRHQVCAVVSQPDQPAGRRMEFKPTVVSETASELGISLLKPQRLRGDIQFLAELQNHQPEALLTASYGQILPRSVLSVTPWPLNVHPSALPKLRGASPIRTALLQGLRSTECCIMKMTPRLDDGAILRRSPCEIPLHWNYAQLEQELGELGGRLAVQALDQVAQGIAQPVEQDHEQASYCGTYRREDSVIDWSRSAAELFDFVRAWDPDIGALTALPDGKRLKVWLVQPALDQSATHLPPGSIVSADKSGILVRCGQDALSILELQPENKRRMSAGEFLAGTKLLPGSRLG